MSRSGSPTRPLDSSVSKTPPTTSTFGSRRILPEISTMSVILKLPPFWPADLDLWFTQVEAQFACRCITPQQSKFQHVVSSLAPEVAVEVRDLLVNPPSDDPNNTLKTQLTTASEQKKLQLLFTSEELGTRKPTQLLCHLQQLLGNRPTMTDDSFCVSCFSNVSPSEVYMV